MIWSICTLNQHLTYLSVKYTDITDIHACLTREIFMTVFLKYPFSHAMGEIPIYYYCGNNYVECTFFFLTRCDITWIHTVQCLYSVTKCDGLLVVWCHMIVFVWYDITIYVPDLHIIPKCITVHLYYVYPQHLLYNCRVWPVLRQNILSKWITFTFTSLQIETILTFLISFELSLHGDSNDTKHYS
jgi:hypothetical protein